MRKFYLPTEITSGVGSFAGIGQAVARFGQPVPPADEGKVLLVCGAKALRASGQLDRALKLLAEAGLDVILYDGLAGEPTLAQVEQGLVMARRERVAVVLGIGGGSAMDVAKTVAGLCPYDGTVSEYHSGERQIEGPGLPWVAAPTTAGTGAEVTKNAVLTDPDRDVKKSIRHDSWFARVAIVDPELTLSMPPAVTASTGSDALCQAIESLVSIGAMPETDALAAEAIRLIGRSLVRAYREGDNLEARADMLYGSMLAGMALSNARLGAVHGLAHPLGHHCHIPHGVICGLLLPGVMAYNLEYAEEKYARAASLLGCHAEGMERKEAARLGVERVRDILQKIELPLRLRDLDVPRADFPRIIEESLPSGSMKHNPRPLEAADLQIILEAAW
jgi:alcohol dehydrogenase class IV